MMSPCPCSYLGQGEVGTSAAFTSRQQRAVVPSLRFTPKLDWKGGASPAGCVPRAGAQKQGPGPLT